jgi:replicative DNA helicase
MAERTMPHDDGSERAVLAGCILEPDGYDTASGIVDPPMFYAPRHADIFGAIGRLRDRGEAIDFVTIGAELGEKVNTCGGREYIAGLTDDVVTAAHIETHARRVRDLSTIRAAMNAARKIDGEGYAATNAEEFRNLAQSLILEATDVTEQRDPVPLSVAIGERLNGHETGIRCLDDMTGGWHGSELVIVAARPSVGKTAFTLPTCLHVARTTGKPVLFFSCEMPRIELANRLMCAEAKVDGVRMRNNLLTGDDMKALAAASASIYQTPLWIDDGNASLARVRSKARKIKREKGLSMIAIDYLQIMDIDEDAARLDIAFARVTRGLKQLAKELDVPIMLLSQLNRGVENRGKEARPMLRDLRECGAIEQDADVVMFIHRNRINESTLSNDGELIVAKQRNGPTGTVPILYRPERTQFVDPSADPNPGDAWAGSERRYHDAAE